mgnify:CR=1 FL=1
MGILLTISDLLIPVTVLCIVVFGCLQRMDIYEVFLEGAKEGLQTVLDILPTLIGLMMAVEVMRAGGLLDILVRLIRPAAEAVGFPAELAPLSLVRLVSSSAATGLLTDLFAKYGPDSFLGRTASVMMSCTETVFYMFTAWFSEDMQKFINSFYSCGVYILLQMFKYLAVITTAASLQPIRKQYFQNFRNSHKEKEE